MTVAENQRPTFSANLPEYEYTDGADACALASAYFGDPLAWQEWVMAFLLACDGDDRYICRSFAMSLPRQNGKSWLIRARCLYGAVVSGERILFTCQHGDTSDEMFKAFAEIFEDEENPALNGLLKAVRRTNGQQAIYLSNGGLIRFTTRTNSLARGKTYDVLIYDEAQELTTAQQAASLPTISASPTHNSQRIYLGTPPTEETSGDVFETMHERVHAGESSTPWVEWSVQEVGDVNDRARWERCNPSFGALLDAAAIEGEASDMPPESFATERLGWFRTRKDAVETVIPAEDWKACRVGRQEAAQGAEPPIMALGVKFTSDGALGAFSVCRAGDAPTVEALDILPMHECISAAAEWCAANAGDLAAVAIDGRHGTAALAARLASAGLPKPAVKEASTRDAVSANSMFCDAVASRAVGHFGQAPLDDSATKTAKRRIGADGFGFESTEDAEASLVESAALAFWALKTTRRNPHRKVRRL